MHPLVTNEMLNSDSCGKIYDTLRYPNFSWLIYRQPSWEYKALREEQVSGPLALNRNLTRSIFSSAEDNIAWFEVLFQDYRSHRIGNIAVELFLPISGHEIILEKLRYHFVVSKTNRLMNIWFETTFLEERVYAFIYRWATYQYRSRWKMTS